MSFVATAVIVGTTLYTQRESRKAAEQARKDQQEDAIDARKAEVFAETEGQGLGQTGNVSLEVDDELDEDAEVNVSI